MSSKPNILFIFTDQQSSHMMSSAGTTHVQTPAMDSLAERGLTFTRAYCTNPVCVPSRFSLMTGRMPSHIDLRANNARHITEVPEEVTRFGLGHVIGSAGYELAYGGKVHLPKMEIGDVGFENYFKDEREDLADWCVEFLKAKHDKPFFLVASFINPHDICYMAIRDFADDGFDKQILEWGKKEVAQLDEALRLPEGMSEDQFFAEVCPPLPENHEVQENEPEEIRHLVEKRPFRKRAREQYSEKQWRMHRWAYAKLTELVDRQISRVLEALRSQGLENDTLVVFSSDHGDLDSAHKMEHKTAFYEEASSIPFIMSMPGSIPHGESSSLVSNGLDLMPTLCDYAGISVPEHCRGRSLKALAECGDELSREHIPLENSLGRMLVEKRYKYIRYDLEGTTEELFDLLNDPGEMRSCHADEEKQEVMRDMRERFDLEFGFKENR